MTLTKDQIISKLSPRLVNKLRKSIVWGDIVSAVATASNSEKDGIIDALKSKNYLVAGTILGNILQKSLEETAVDNVTQALANNSLNIDEISEILE